MLPGILAESDVMQWSSRVLVNGIERPHVSWDLSKSWHPDLPAQLAGSSSMSSDGSIVWASSRDVASREVSALRDWGQWRPKKGDHVVIMQGDGASEWVRFTGLMDKTTGRVGDNMRSTVVADIDPLTTPFEHDAMLGVMPPNDGASTWRNTGLSPMYFVDAAVRWSGYYATPKREPENVLSVPCQGSMLPEYRGSGQYLSGAAITGGGAFQEMWPAPWGLAVGNVVARYKPRLSRLPSETTQLTVMISPEHAETGYVDIYYGTAYLRLLLSASRVVVVQTFVAGVLGETCRLTAAQMSGSTTVTVLMKSGAATLRNNLGVTASGVLPSLGAVGMSRIDITAGVGSRLAAVQVSHPAFSSEEFASLYHQPSARYRLSSVSTPLWGIINAAPRIEQGSALGVVQEIADSMLAAMWIDELGVLNFAPSNVLREAPPLQVLTTTDSIFDLSWSDNLLASASSVTAVWKHPALSRGELRTVVVARGATSSLKSKEEAEDVYGPGADEDWVGVDDTLTVLGAGTWAQFNAGVGSFAGVFYTASGETTSSAGLSTTISMQKTGLAEYTVKHLAGTFPADVSAELATSPTDASLWPRNRDVQLPELRAYAKLAWRERRTAVTASSQGPALEVAVGPWATESTAQRVGAYVAVHAAAPQPALPGVEVVPDPRRQIGDVIRIDSPDLLGVSITCLITGMNESMSDSATQNLNLIVLSIEAASLTWGEWLDAFPDSLTYGQWLALRGPTDTYAGFNAEPLKGA